MLYPIDDLRDTHIIGNNCREWIIGKDRFPILRDHNFLCIGYSSIRPPYFMVKRKVEASLVVACHSGTAGVYDFKNGTTRVWEPGQVLLCPRGASYGYEAISEEPWLIAWAMHLDSESVPMVDGKESTIIEADCADYINSIQMLARESATNADPAALQALTSLIYIQMRRISSPNGMDRRIAKLWERVESDLGYSWSNTTMANYAHMSEEHLRRLCLRHYGQSPMKHLQQLRMHRACARLRTEGCTIEAIACQLGFSNVYSFSAAFKRWAGVPPGEFRRNGLKQTPNESIQIA